MATLRNFKQSDTSARLVAWWKFDEGNGNVVSDSVGKNNGTIQGAKWTQGKAGKALSFDGISDEVKIKIVDDGSIAGIAENFTIVLWVNPLAEHAIDDESDAVGAAGCFGQKYAIEPAYGESFWGDGHAGIGLSVGTNGVSVYEHAQGYLPALLVWEGEINGFTHIAVVYENNQPKLYIDGHLKKTGLKSTKVVHPLVEKIGGMTYGYFKGEIDDVRIYNYALRAEQIAEVCAGKF